jgi:glyoxylase-like metal-dependent hydrolase (beta-lactamase superfamily II)
MGWIDHGGGCYSRRYEPFDVTVGAVIGADGVLVIDTRATPAQGAEVLDDLRQLTTKPVRWVMNTHWHFDHCFGNATVGDVAEIWAHDTVPAMLADNGDKVRGWLAGQSPVWAEAMESLIVKSPAHTFATAAAIDLGDRGVEVIHLGRGHTDGDVVVRLLDRDVLYAGDLIEQSGPPAYGDDSFPFEWPVTLGRLDGLLTDRSVVVPGHGDAVDRPVVAGQSAAIGQVADTIVRSFEAGVSEAEARREAEWPFPAEGLAEAVRRGYAHLAMRHA